MSHRQQAIAVAPPEGDERLSAHGLRVVTLGEDTVVLKRGVSEVRLAFPGAAQTVERLTELADGTATVQRLVEAFPSDVHEDIRRLVTGLRARGLLHELTGDTQQSAVQDDPTTGFWNAVAVHTPDARARVTAASALVFGTGAVAKALHAALRDCGVGRVLTGDGPDGHAGGDIWCAATDGSPEQLMDPARAALRAGAVFLPVWIEDLVIRIGPLAHPYDTACLRCYLLRVDANDPHREVHRLLRQQDTPAGFLPSMAAVAGQVAAIEAVKHLAGLPVTACGRAIELSLVPFRASVHRVLRVPRCPECSGTARQSAPIVTHGPPIKE